MLHSANITDKKGITLIELIIVLAIIGLVIGMAFSLFGFGNNVFKNGSLQFDVQSATRLASQFVTQEARYAADIEIFKTKADAEVGGIDFEDNDTIPVYENYLYYDNASGAVIKVNKFATVVKNIGTGGVMSFFSPDPYKTLNYQITANEGARSYSLGNQVYSLNLSLGTNKAIIGQTDGGVVIKYRTLSDYISGSQAPTVIIGTANSSTALELDCSKAINIASAFTLITDQGTPSSSKFGDLSFPDSNTVRISFDPAVQNNRQLDLQISFYEYDGTTTSYAYTIKYSNSTLWAIQ